jgi:hypothetical protein
MMPADGSQARMIADSECSPLIPNLIRNHFSTLATLNLMTRKRAPVLQHVVDRLRSTPTKKRAQAEAQAEAASPAAAADEGQVRYQVAPELEGRIVRIGS